MARGHVGRGTNQSHGGRCAGRMFRGGAAVAVPISSRPTGRLNLTFQQPGGTTLHQSADCELKQRWSSGLNGVLRHDNIEAQKPENKSLPQWKRKQEPEKKPDEPEKKAEPLWKRIRETEKKAEQNKKPELEETPEITKKPEVFKKPEDEKKAEVDIKPELFKSNNLFRKPEAEKKPDSGIKTPKTSKIAEEVKPEPEKAERRRPEPLWKKKQEPVKSQEPERKPEPLWKRKFEPPKRTEPEKTTELRGGGGGGKIEPLWKIRGEAPTRRQEPQEKKKEEEEGKVEPIWKRKREPLKTQEAKNKQQQQQQQQQPGKVEPPWKRRQDGAEKTKTTAVTEKQRKTEELPDGDEEEEEEKNKIEELICPMCSELYDEDDVEPVQLPRCGHTFCRACLLKVKGKGHFPCPTCRKRHLKPPLEDIPVLSEVLNRAAAYREEKLGKCHTHQEPLAFWCRECQASLCPSCRVKEGHDIVRTKVVVQEMRQEMKEKGEVIMENVTEEKKKIIDSVRTCSVQLLKVCDASATIDDDSQDVKEMLSDTRQTVDLGFLLGSLKRMKSILTSLSKTSSDSETVDEANKTPRMRRRRERQAAQKNGDSSQTEVPKVVAKQVNVTPKTPTTSVDKLATGKQERGFTKETKPADGRVAYYGQRGEAAGEVFSHGPLLTVAEPSLWPLTCCVYDEDGRRAQLSWEGGRLHMSALADHLEAAHFMIKLSVIQSVVPQDSPEVFLEVGVREHVMGRIYIKLWGHLRRAQHFLALCMGTHGPSYRGAKFEEVFSRGLKGECIHAGPYLTPAGELSAQRVMDALEWDGKFKRPQRKGLVVGAGSGRHDRESCFDICTIDNPTRDFACPFGEVVAGWDAVMAVVEHRPVREVTMVDVGVVVPDLHAIPRT